MGDREKLPVTSSAEEGEYVAAWGKTEVARLIIAGLKPVTVPAGFRYVKKDQSFVRRQLLHALPEHLRRRCSTLRNKKPPSEVGGSSSFAGKRP